MKLILAIVSSDDSSMVSSALTKNNFSVTKLATTGGFLMSGNTTFLIGTEDENVDKAISVIGEHSKKRNRWFLPPRLMAWECTRLSGRSHCWRSHHFCPGCGAV